MANTPVDLKETDVIVLCGGLGTRLRRIVSDRPKILARLGEKVFLDILVANLMSQGFKKITLCAGYARQQIKEYAHQRRYDLTFSDEEEPLGTGGALKKARGLIKSDPFMVVNGDSICEVDFKTFMGYHVSKKGLLSIVLTKSRETEDCGSVSVNASGQLTSFKEKAGDNSGWISAGIYSMNQDSFSFMPDQKTFSLEYYLFPNIIKKAPCYGFLTESPVIDIGTPERYEKAVKLLK